MKENVEAWNQAAYDAWLTRFGTPEQYGERLVNHPEKIVSGLLEHLGDIKGKQIANLMGSNGNKAVSFALLGAKVTVVDFSKENEKYALELAKAAGVEIAYIVDDVLKSAQHLPNTMDIAVAEMGILHYFTDLVPFFKAVRDTLKPGGIAVIRDFHPVSTKLIESRGSTAKVRKHKVTGDYFSEALVPQEVAYGKYLEGEEKETITVLLRKWTLGEIVTSAADAGLMIKKLFEYPNQSSEVFDAGIPKTFTLVLENPV